MCVLYYCIIENIGGTLFGQLGSLIILWWLYWSITIIVSALIIYSWIQIRWFACEISYNSRLIVISAFPANLFTPYLNSAHSLLPFTLPLPSFNFFLSFFSLLHHNYFDPPYFLPPTLPSPHPSLTPCTSALLFWIFTYFLPFFTSLFLSPTYHDNIDCFCRFQSRTFSVCAGFLKHRVASFGYVITENDLPGRCRNNTTD